MALDEVTLQENAAAVAPASGNDSAAQIDQVEFKANAEVKALESEEGRLNGAKGSALGGAEKHSAGSVLLDAGLDAVLPGAKMLSTVSEFISERGQDMAAKGFSAQPKTGQTDGIMSGNARTIEQDIRGASRQAGSYSTSHAGGDLISRANNAVNSLFNRGSTDKFGTDQLAGGRGKQNEGTLPVKPEAASQLTKSMENIFSKKNVHKLAQDSVLVARAERSAALAKAQQIAPQLGLGLGSGPQFNATQILQEAERYRDQQGKA